MYQTIHEKIAVVGLYRESQFVPKKFLWQGKAYKIDSITFIADVKDGGVKKRWYALMAGGNVYRLLFDRMNETWILEEVWCD